MNNENVKQLAETAESADDKEDKDYQNQAQPGHQSDEGYIQDDAQKAETADDNEDEEYKQALAWMDSRYGSNAVVQNLLSRMKALEDKMGAGNDDVKISLDDPQEQQQ